MSDSALVIGGGIAGIQSSIDLANMGFQVYLVEKSPSIGGRMTQLDKTFPTNDCAMCILAPKMIECYRHPNIEVMSYAEVAEVTGNVGDFNVKVHKKTSYIDETKCTGCGDCAEVCPVTIKSEFEQGMGDRKAVYKPFAQAIPNVFTIDKKGIPPCRAACPAGVNAQGYIALISQGKFKEAIEVLRRSMPFAGVCGRVCTHPCETECERGKLDEAVSIRALKRFMADYELKNGRETAVPVKRTKEDSVAIIGSGPAGLACAYDLAREGYPVTVFEAAPEAGGLLRYGIPEYRLPKRVLDNEIDYVKELGVEIKTSTPVTNLSEMFNQGYEAIFLGTGAWVSSKLGIPNEDADGVFHALDFLRQANSGEKIELGDKVAVIGGGNAAVDAARVAKRLGASEVTIIYRRTRNEMPAIDNEVDEAQEEGIKLQLLAAPTEVLTRNNKLSGIQCIKMKLGEPDESGRRRPAPVEGSEYTADIDNLIIAIGQNVDKAALSDEIKYTERGTIATDPITLETNAKGVFAGGDAIAGTDNGYNADVISAVAAGKEAAISIDRYLRGADLKKDRSIKPKCVQDINKKDVKQAPRHVMPLIEPEKRRGFDEVELGFDEKAAVDEARRCLNCGVCCDCRECEKVCQANAINHDASGEEYININAGAIVVATGLDFYDISGLTEYGYGKIPNVITAIQYERLTAASGPTSGELKRPSDGKIPSNIAFVQCVGSRDFANKKYCSSVCCMFACKEAILAYEHHPGTKSTIFYMDIRAVGKRFQEYISRAKSEYNVSYIRGRPGRIEVNPANGNPVIWYEDTTAGETKKFETELVILCQAMVPNADIQELAERLGIEVDQNGFVKTPDKLFYPLDTTRAGIFACGYVHSPRDIPDSVVQASGAAARVAESLSPSKKVVPSGREKIVPSGGKKHG